MAGRRSFTDEGGQGRGHVVHDPGKEDERITPTGGGGRIRLITIRNHDSSGGNVRSSCEQFNVNRYPLIKAGCGRGWARHCTWCTPGNPTTLSKFFCRCASTVSCGKHYASQPDGLRTARRSVVGTERSVGIYSILFNDCVYDRLCGSRPQVVSDERVFYPKAGGARLVAELVNWVRKTLLGQYYPLFPARTLPFGVVRHSQCYDGCIRESH